MLRNSQWCPSKPKVPHKFCILLAPPSMRFSRQEYWSGLLFPPPGNIPHPGIEPMSLALTGWFFTTKPPGKPKGFYRGLQLVKVLV